MSIRSAIDGLAKSLAELVTTAKNLRAAIQPLRDATPALDVAGTGTGAASVHLGFSGDAAIEDIDALAKMAKDWLTVFQGLARLCGSAPVGSGNSGGPVPETLTVSAGAGFRERRDSDCWRVR